MENLINVLWQWIFGRKKTKNIEESEQTENIEESEHIFVRVLPDDETKKAIENMSPKKLRSHSKSWLKEMEKYFDFKN